MSVSNQTERNRGQVPLPNGTTEVFLHQQSLYEAQDRRQLAQHNHFNPLHRLNGPPIIPAADPHPHPYAPVLPLQIQEDSIDREIEDTNTIMTGSRVNTGLPPKPAATYKDSLPQTVSP
ncbi:hypothetical protein FIBSPDRAFT_963844 [Athelia psychrophila]|uniref:Uncharacterized protein n=1 Tax=Athelia psychrophila TaxID=1759441 RepID=A0A165YGT5_9AGAM|nr:hypothetical protein FIBSPDRAFT_963844 [Fibularhizoctonia sp. CBS 109695]